MNVSERLQQAAICERNGENLTQFAEIIGLTPQAASQWLRNNAPKLHGALKQNRRRTDLAPYEIKRRLQLLVDYESGGKKYVEHGLTLHALLMFRLRYAPDGAQEALDELD